MTSSTEPGGQHVPWRIGRTLHPGTGTGPVLRLDLPLSFWGGVDHDGTIIDRHHPRRGQSITGRVLAMTSGRGSSSSSSVLAELLRTGAGPAAILLTEPDAIVVLGAIVADELYGTRTPVVCVTAEELAGLPDGRPLTVDTGAHPHDQHRAEGYDEEVQEDPAPRPDTVDQIVEQWRRERPDLDPSPLGVIGRIHRLDARLNILLHPDFGEHGLSHGEFEVLAALRRAGTGHPLTPSQLMGSMMVTSGATTKRIDRLERAGLVRRAVTPEDGRVRLVSLTDEGRALVDELVTRHLDTEGRLLAGLDAEERATLAALLRRLGHSLPDPPR